MNTAPGSIAFVPRPEDMEEFVRDARELHQRLYPEKAFGEVILELLKIYAPMAAWERDDVRRWAENPSSLAEGSEELSGAAALLFKEAAKLYDRRAQTLAETHPLGLQVDLSTGVANGVLVVRTVAQCAELLRAVVLNEMAFELKPERPPGGGEFRVLREKISGCVYRVVTSDQLLTNSFWNFYLGEQWADGEDLGEPEPAQSPDSRFRRLQEKWF